jgi:hypothetical protein
VGRGPAFFHPHRRPVAHYDLAKRLRPGSNVVAVLVRAIGVAIHNYIPSGAPGLVARLALRFRDGSVDTVQSDRSWKATDQTGWLTDVPRRSWALACVEHFDAPRAPGDWQSLDFDDRHWSPAEEHPPFPPGVAGIYQDPGLPRLRFAWQPAAKRLSHQAIYARSPYNFDGEPWLEPVKVRVVGRGRASAGAFRLEGLDGDEGAALVFDLGRQYTGGVAFDLECASEGRIDIGWSERLRYGRPQVQLKGCTYADRYLARPGWNRWQPIYISSARYLLLSLRRFRGPVRFHRLGLLASEPDLPWRGAFSCSDEGLNRIWRLCERSLRVGTQEGLMDCPTREQASYAGDGNPTAEWIGRLTGDYSHWRYLLRETFAVQSADGLVKTTTFSGCRHFLLDYVLLSVVGAARHWEETGDRRLVREILPACRRAVAWFERRINAEGVYDLPWETLSRDASWVAGPASADDTVRDCGFNYFIDHPGLGWHNEGDPGLDRRGLNAAMNALLAITLRALAGLVEAADEPGADAYRATADRLVAAGRRFWNPRAKAFADGWAGGTWLRQISQQTNLWCLAAGFPGPGSAAAVIERILDPADSRLCRCGPYFWLYGLPVLARAGLTARALGEVRRLWTPMLDGGATTLWETFAGDQWDSYCHPWSGAPLDFLMRYVGGIGSLPEGRRHITLRPRPDLLRAVRTRVQTILGPVTVEWEKRGSVWRLAGSLPRGIEGRLELPGRGGERVAGRWAKNVPARGPWKT